MPEPAREFLGRRFAELGGFLLLGGVGAVSLSLATWSVHDPSWNHASGGAVHNLAGPVGAVVADLVMQTVGIAVVALLPPVFCWGLTLMSRRRLDHLRLRLSLLAAGGCAGPGARGGGGAPRRLPLRCPPPTAGLCRAASAASWVTASWRCPAGSSARPSPC